MPVRRNFSGGEISPSLYTRPDLLKYQNGLRVCKNFVVQRDGSVYNRPGTELVRELGDRRSYIFSGRVCLVELRAVNDAASSFDIIVHDLVYSTVTDLDSQLSVGATGSLSEVKGLALGDSVLLLHELLPTREVYKDDADGAWRLREFRYLPTPYPSEGFAQVATATGFAGVSRGATGTAEAGVGGVFATLLANTPTLTVSGPLKESYPTQLGSLAVGTVLRARVALWTSYNERYRYDKVGNGYLVRANYRGPAYLLGLQDLRVGDSVFVSPSLVSNYNFSVRQGGAWKNLSYRSHSSGTEGVKTISTIGTNRGLPSFDTDYAIWDGEGLRGEGSPAAPVLTPRVYINTALATGLVSAVGTGGEADFLRNVKGTYAQRTDETPYRVGTSAQRVSRAVLFAALTADGIGVYATYALVAIYAGNVPSSPLFVYTTDSFPSSQGGKVYLAFEVKPEGDPLYVQVFRRSPDDRKKSRDWGYVGLARKANFSDENFAFFEDDLDVDPDYDISLPPSTTELVDQGNYPAVGLPFQQRLVVGGSVNAPSSFTASAVGTSDRFDWDKSNISDADALQAALPGERDVMNFGNLKRLVIFTEDGEYVAGEAFTPSGVSVVRHGGVGSHPLHPVNLEDSIIFLQRGGRVVRSFGFDINIDGYRGGDLTIFASHLFEQKTVQSWDKVIRPSTHLWLCQNDGKMLCLTFVKEQQIFAWSRHEIKGATVESISFGGNNLYFIVRRGNKRYLEKLGQADTEHCFVDSAVHFKFDVATKNLTGLEHLAEQEVSVYADGNVVSSPDNPKTKANALTVSATGTLTLKTAAKDIWVGLPIDARIETLPVEVPSEEFSLYYNKLLVNGVSVIVRQSRGGWARSAPPIENFGLSFNGEADARSEWFEFRGRDLRPTPRDGVLDVEVQGRWQSQGGGVEIRQFDPLPLNLIGLIIQGDFGGGRK